MTTETARISLAEVTSMERALSASSFVNSKNALAFIKGQAERIEREAEELMRGGRQIAEGRKWVNGVKAGT
jgi:hypothetical protein